MCWKKRKTIEIAVCAASGLLPNQWCIETVKRRFYVDPRPGEPIAPTTVCPPIPPIPPDPDVIVNVCAANNRTPNQYCPVLTQITVKQSALPLPVCVVHVKPEPIVKVDACSVSWLTPNAGCPKPWTTRPVLQSKLPLAPCKLHTPPEPILQADTSAPRTGMDFYQMIAFPLEAAKKYLDDLVKNGGSLQRFFGDYIWPEHLPSAGWHYSLFKQVGWWKDVGGQFDGDTFPLFTIAPSAEYGAPWNETVWLKYLSIFKLCAERNIRVTWSVLDGCSMRSPEDHRYQPLINSYQHLGAEPSVQTYARMDGTTGRGLGLHTGGIYGGFGGDGGVMKSYLPALIKKVVDTLNASGVDYRINPGNEMAREKKDCDTQADIDAILYDWHDFWITELKKLGVPNNKIVVSIAGPNTREGVTLKLKEKCPGIIEQLHGPNSDESYADCLRRFPGAEIDGDGQDSHAAGFDNGYMKLPSCEQCRKIRELLKANGRTYQTFNAHTEWKNPKVNDITRACWEEQQALAGR